MVNYDYLYNKNFYADKINLNHFSDKRLHFRIVRNATILPHVHIEGTNGFGGVVDERNEYVKGTFVHRNTGAVYTPTEEVQYSPTTAVYFGMLIHIWGHCLTDNLKRVWFFKNSIYRRYFRNCPVVYAPMWGGLIPNCARLLEILGLDVSKLLAVVQPTKFQTLIIPDESFFFEDLEGTPQSETVSEATTFFTQEYIDTVSEIRNFAQKNSTPLSRKKIFYFHGDKQLNEEALADYFHSKGYEIVRPENFSMDEQLNILTNAESFAAAVGSTSHNSLFLRDHTEVILIPRYVDGSFNQYQQAVNDVFEQNIVYVDSTLSMYGLSQNGLFFYTVSYLLKKYFGDEFSGEYTDEEFEAFIKYCKVALANGMPQNPNAGKYYCTAPILKFLAQVKQREDLQQKYGVKLT